MYHTCRDFPLTLYKCLGTLNGCGKLMAMICVPDHVATRLAGYY